MVRYAFTVRDSHPLLLAGLPAHIGFVLPNGNHIGIFSILSHRVSDPVFCLPSVLNYAAACRCAASNARMANLRRDSARGVAPSPAISHARASTSADRVGSASMDKFSAWQNPTLRRQQQPWQRSTGPEAPSASAGLFHVTRSEPPKDRLLKSLNRKNAARCG